MEPIGDGMSRSTRYWSHKLAEDEVERYIPGTGKRKFKKDSRTWLHKSSKNFKTEAAKDVPPEAKPSAEKKSLEMDKQNCKGEETIEGEESLVIENNIKTNNLTTSRNNKDAPGDTKMFPNGDIKEQEFGRCLDKEIQSIPETGNTTGTNNIDVGSDLKKTGNLEEQQQKIGLSDTAANPEESLEPVNGVVLTDSELCLRAESLALCKEVGLGKVVASTPSSGSATATPASSNSSQEKNSSKAVTKNLKKLSIGPDGKGSSLKLTKAARGVHVAKSRKVVTKYAKKSDGPKVTKARVKSCTNTPMKSNAKPRRVVSGKTKSRIPSLIRSADIKARRKGRKLAISIKKLTKNQKLKAGSIKVKKSAINESLQSNLNSETGNVTDISVISSIPKAEGHTAEDNLLLSDLEKRSSKTTNVEKDTVNMLPTQKLSENDVRIRKRKNTVPVNRSTSTSSIQEKRSRDSLCEDLKTSWSKRDRRPPRHKSVETSLSVGRAMTVQSCSASSLQVQCSTTQGSLEDSDGCASSTLVKQGSDSSFTVSTPRGCLSCPWITSRDGLWESQSEIFKDVYTDDQCIMLAPSPGNHCLSTINMENLNERLDSKFEESAHILHRTKALLRQQYLEECWEMVSKSDTSLLSDLQIAWD